MVMQTTADKLDDLRAHAKVIHSRPPAVFFSDLHIGDGGSADDFAPNKGIFEDALLWYKGWTTVAAGDVEELYQFKKKEILTHYRFDIELRGNHDEELDQFPLAVVLKAGGEETFISHGHAKDIWNDDLSWVGRTFTRYVWKPLEHLGIKDPPPSVNRHERQRGKLIEWANARRVNSVFGHIHTLEHDGYYHNSGSAVQPGVVECIELVSEGFRPVRWTKEGRFRLE